jgi:hypothetical protein
MFDIAPIRKLRLRFRMPLWERNLGFETESKQNFSRILRAIDRTDSSGFANQVAVDVVGTGLPVRICSLFENGPLQKKRALMSFLQVFIEIVGGYGQSFDYLVYYIRKNFIVCGYGQGTTKSIAPVMAMRSFLPCEPATVAQDNAFRIFPMDRAAGEGSLCRDINRYL